MNNENSSVYHELLLNKSCPINEQYFCQLLIKASNIYHTVAIKKPELRCKYFNEEYNIIRNDHIGIGHILALVIYTDATDFCTAFRATYRKSSPDILPVEDKFVYTDCVCIQLTV